MSQPNIINKQYFKNNESLAVRVKKFRTNYGRNFNLTSATVKRVIEKLRKTGSIADTNTDPSKNKPIKGQYQSSA
ncbi:unnamed protein product [Diabrotica balteata]|uniref:DUF4817 domain-containing protein n=1 Tax=Diabrotica balteata TaxID=107213 RepID=A0A9N9T876_DIABA|nr:unnamed protein product [Diabrotica balteata]